MKADNLRSLIIIGYPLIFMFSSPACHSPITELFFQNHFQFAFIQVLSGISGYIGDFAIPEIIIRCHGRDFRVLRFEEKPIFDQPHQLPGSDLAQFLVQSVNIRKRGTDKGIGGDTESMVKRVST